MARKHDWLNDDQPKEYRRFRHHKWPREYAGQPVDSYYQAPSRDHERHSDERSLKYAWQAQSRPMRDGAKGNRPRVP
jgi:hypothetical protein